MTRSFDRLHVCAHHGNTSVVSRLIRLQTRSEWNHISLVIDNIVYESIEGVGVRTRDAEALALSHQSKREFIQPLRLVTPPIDDQIADVKDFMLKQLRKPYDYTMVARFISRENRESLASQEKWFCSEIVFAALEHAGISLLRDTSAWEVSPGLLVRSPLLEREPEERWDLRFARRMT